MLEQQLEKKADIPSIDASAINEAGNLYLSNVERRSINLSLTCWILKQNKALIKNNVVC